MNIKLYVEGGGDTADLKIRCREGFRKFLEKAGFQGRMPRIVACGGRRRAFESFRNALEQGDAALLLIDSEDLMTSQSPWRYLADRTGDGFAKPAHADDGHCHLMVVCMESWFLADVEALKRFYGAEFNENALPGNPRIEQIPKQDVYQALAAATARCGAKERYSKGRHSFLLLRDIDPRKVRTASPWADRFLSRLAEVVDPA